MGNILILAFSVLAVSITWLVPTQGFAQSTSPVIKINEAAARADITVQGLRGDIRVLFGSGGNITVLTGPEGKLLVDAGIAVSRSKIQAALDGISQAPIKYLVNTHYHWDHTPMAMNGCTILVQLSWHTKTPSNTFPSRRE